MKIQVGVDLGSYVFTPGTAGNGTIVFSGLSGLTLQQILLVADVTTGAILYNPLDGVSLATFSSNTLTLAKDTSSLSASHALQIWINWSSTQNVSGTVSVSNFPAAQVVEVSDGTNILGTPTHPLSVSFPASDKAAPGATTAPSQITVMGGKTADGTPKYQPLPLTAGGSAVSVRLTETPNIQVPVYDNTVLDNLTVNAPGPGLSYLTTGYQRISFQASGIFAGDIIFEGSNDGTVWFQLTSQCISDGTITDVITGPGLYTVPAGSQFVRYNVFDLDTGSVHITAIGKIAPQEVTPLLAQAFDGSTSVQLNANIAGGLQRDVNSAVIESDAPSAIYLRGAVGSNIILDTQGYDSLQITTQALAANITTSNDQITWAVLTGFNLASLMAGVSAVVANSSFVFPCQARYIRISLTTGGTATAYLRSAPFPSNISTANITQWASVAAVSGGVGGSVGVGGPSAVGVAPTSNPVQVGGADSSNIARRLLTDTSGRPALAITDQQAVLRALTALAPPATNQFVPSLPVQDLATYEGQTTVELLAQLLTEVRISNYYLFNLPNLLAGSDSLSTSEEPASLRNEPSVLI